MSKFWSQFSRGVFFISCRRQRLARSPCSVFNRPGSPAPGQLIRATSLGILAASVVFFAGAPGVSEAQLTTALRINSASPRGIAANLPRDQRWPSVGTVADLPFELQWKGVVEWRVDTSPYLGRKARVWFTPLIRDGSPTDQLFLSWRAMGSAWLDGTASSNGRRLAWFGRIDSAEVAAVFDLTLDASQLAAGTHVFVPSFEIEILD